MKIKEMLMILQAGDASDHWDPTKHDEEPEKQWYHDSDGCNYCAAARAAESFAADVALPGQFFEAGDKVFLPGRIPGRVMGTDVTVRVEVQNGEHGPWAVGSFSPLALIARDDSPQCTYWSNKADDVWEREESTQRVRLIRYDGQTMPVKPWAIINRTFDDLLDVHGAVIQVDKP